MFRLALSGHIYFSPFETPTLTLCLLAPRNTWCGHLCFGAQVSSKYGTWCSERVILQFMCAGCLAGVTYLCYTVLTSPKKDETAVHCCDPALSVLVMLVSRNVFHVVSALQSLSLFHIFSAGQVSCRSYVGSVYRMRNIFRTFSKDYRRLPKTTEEDPKMFRLYTNTF